jgi:hypothetical protein
MFNYQKSQKNREILPKVIKITESGHTGNSSRFPYCFTSTKILTRSRRSTPSWLVQPEVFIRFW